MIGLQTGSDFWKCFRNSDNWDSFATRHIVSEVTFDGVFVTSTLFLNEAPVDHDVGF